MNYPKILTLDIETAPLVSYTWGLFDQNVGLNQIKSDWFILAWAARWYGDPEGKAMYMDNSNAKDIRNDKALVKGIVDLIEEADIVVTQNGEAFDLKKINARAIINKLSPVKVCRSIDILKESRKVFKFTSHKLEYMTSVLNDKYKKLKHEEYPGFDLWKAILNGDKKAWKVMKSYCIHDVLSTEEAFTKLRGWIKLPNLATYFDISSKQCLCGSSNLIKKGFVYTDTGKYQGYKCLDCGKRPKSRINLLSKDKRANLLKGSK